MHKYRASVETFAAFNKQEDVVDTVQMKNYDLITSRQPWWDELHDWHATIDEYKLSGAVFEEIKKLGA